MTETTKDWKPSDLCWVNHYGVTQDKGPGFHIGLNTSYHNLCGFQNILQDEDIDTVLSYPTVSKEDIPEPYGHKHTLEQCLMCWNAKEIKHYVASMHYEVHGASSIFYRRHWEAGMKFLPGNLGIRTQKGEDSDHNTRMTLLLQRTSILTLPLYGYRKGSTTNFSFQESI